MSKVMVSVIVTVYNKEKVLKRAVESIVGQTYSDLEIVLVNDGSLDNSGRICDELSLLDNRIVVVHQDNLGQVSARKSGLRVAHGEYVLFVDADDWIDKKAIQELLEIAQKNGGDVITSGWITHSGEKELVIKDAVPEGKYFSIDEKKIFARYVFFNEKNQMMINDSLNTKFFKKALIEKYLEKFVNNIVYAEDTFVAFVCLANANCVVATNNCYYHYMTDDSTINSKKNEFVLRDLVEGYVYAEKNLPQDDLFSTYKYQLERIFLRYVFLGMNKFMDFSFNHRLIRYFFPENIIPEDAKIALYGAGVVGTSFYYQLKRKYRIEYIIDKNAEDCSMENVMILLPEDAESNKVDYVILAVNDEKTADEIKRMLINEFGWSKDRIIWKKPITLLEKIIYEF